MNATIPKLVFVGILSLFILGVGYWYLQMRSSEKIDYSQTAQTQSAISEMEKVDFQTLGPFVVENGAIASKDPSQFVFGPFVQNTRVIFCGTILIDSNVSEGKELSSLKVIITRSRAKSVLTRKLRLKREDAENGKLKKSFCREIRISNVPGRYQASLVGEIVENSDIKKHTLLAVCDFEVLPVASTLDVK